jgi:hypothetical protein
MTLIIILWELALKSVFPSEIEQYEYETNKNFLQQQTAILFILHS